MCRAAQPAALADRRSDAEPQLRLQVHGHVLERVEADDHEFLFQNNVNPGGKYQIFGTQFNGLSQANAFGDEFQVATNFPLVRITNNATGDVSYASTYDFSTMAVATGAAIVSTCFDVPTDIEIGDSKLEVVANGIPSLPMPITVVRGAALAASR